MMVRKYRTLLFSIFFMVFTFCIGFLNANLAQDNTYDKYSDWVDGYPDGCTSITVGKKASVDGSVITSHTCDSHRTRGYLDIREAQTYKSGETVQLVKRVADDSHAMPAYKYIPKGKIPQVEKTYGYINTAYPAMNDHQLAIGESTFGGRQSLKSE